MFTPLGDKSRRVMILDLVATRKYGDTIAYAELETMLNVDRQTAQAAMHQTIRSLEREQSKTVEAVRNIGYRIVNPGDHLRMATRHQKKARRSVTRAKSKVDHVDMGELTDGEKAAVTLAATALAAQIEFARRADLRYAKREEVESFVSAQVVHNTRTVGELDAVKARMARLEAALAKTA